VNDPCLLCGEHEAGRCPLLVDADGDVACPLLVTSEVACEVACENAGPPSPPAAEDDE
jgi:hypothetical protein